MVRGGRVIEAHECPVEFQKHFLLNRSDLRNAVTMKKEATVDDDPPGKEIRQIFIQPRLLWSAKVNCHDYLCHR